MSDESNVVPLHMGDGGPVIGKAYVSCKEERTVIHMELDNSPMASLFSGVLKLNLTALSVDGTVSN